MTDHWQFHGLLPEAKALHEILEQALPGNRIEPVSFSADERRVIIFSESDRDPGSYYLLDRKTNEMSSIGTRQPQLQSIRPVQTKFFSFPARDGLRINGRILLPANAQKKPPLVVLSDDGDRKFAGRFDYFGQCLVSEGYAVARIDYRGKSGYGEKFSRASDFQQATGQPHDLLDGIDWLAAQGWIDSDRVIACGVYISGLVGLRAAVEARQFKALINIDVPTFLYEPKLKSHGSPYQTEEQMIAALGGAKAADAFMKAQDPTPVWKQLSIPSLNYYPRVWRDNSMSSYGRRLEPILKDLGQPYVMKLQGNLNDLRGQSKETADLVSKHPRGKPRGICSNPPCPIRSFLSLW